MHTANQNTKFTASQLVIIPLPKVMSFKTFQKMRRIEEFNIGTADSNTVTTAFRIRGLVRLNVFPVIQFSTLWSSFFGRSAYCGLSSLSWFAKSFVESLLIWPHPKV